MSGDMLAGLTMFLCFLAGFCVVYYLARRSTRKAIERNPLNTPIEPRGDFVDSMFAALDNVEKDQNEIQRELLASLKGFKAELRGICDDAEDELTALRAVSDDDPFLVSEIAALRVKIKRARERLEEGKDEQLQNGQDK